MYAVRLLISAQFLMMLFHHNSLGTPKIATNSTATIVGRSLREDMLWLNDVYSGMPDDSLVDFPWSSGYLNAIRLLSCSQERANGIYLWQCFGKPYLFVNDVISSKKYCQDMLSQYVPGHHDGKTPLHLSAINLAHALSHDFPDLAQKMEMMILCIIESGVDLHEAVHSYTPLALFLRSISMRSHFRNWRPRDLRRMLKVWLNILQCAGVDLITYGAEESRTLGAHRFIENPLELTKPWDWSFVVSDDELYHFAFSYGRIPDDWTVQFDMVEEYVSDFWRIAESSDERELQAIPGSWIDT
jgi:hypothetical protein